jgi:uncharacterized protein YecE (DUF72 family)
VRVHVGTSGYNYEAWRGSFYPEDLSARKMLSYYAGQFDTVEINYSFYRKPTAKILQGWAAQVPEGFRFALKAWQRITHQKRLRETEELVSSFADAARELGPRLAPVLCIAESDELATPPERTAEFGYFRLRRLDYDEAALRKWAEVVRGYAGEVFVYFKHEDEARGPTFAKQFLPLLEMHR